MGLSTEERFIGALGVLRKWRSDLDNLGGCEGVLNVTHIEAIVEDWVVRVDRLTGLLIEQLNTDRGRWLGTDTPYSLHVLFGAPYRLPDKATEEAMDSVEPATYPSAGYELEFITYRHTAEKLRNKLGGLAGALGAWWDIQEHFSDLLYCVNRYDDGVFRRPFRDAMNELMGNMMNRRFELMMVDSEIEAELLGHYKLIRAELQELWFKEIDAYRDGKPVPEFDDKAFWDRHRKMTAPEVRKALEALADKELLRASADNITDVVTKLGDGPDHIP